tara:strand:- start:6919 stop:11559 length:4641 start_codon:yes stop_codon:yes gene_type:complete
MENPTLCLNMIVKDESHVILSTLENLCSNFKFDYWVISDTGSTDNTVELITNFFHDKQIKGEISNDKWENFGHNRSIALSKAYQKTDYLLIFDADDKIKGTLPIPKVFTTDCYHLKFGKDFSYYRPLLINNRKKWCYIGVLHEFLNELEPVSANIEINGGYYIESGRDGNRNKNGNKYYDDAIILKKGFEDEMSRNNHQLAKRYSFYCGQSYKDAGQQYRNNAIEWYKKRLTFGGWEQELYYSCLMIAEIYHALQDPDNEIKYLLKAIVYDPTRMESIVKAMEHYSNKGEHVLVNLFYYRFKDYTKDFSNKLFVYTTYYDGLLEYYNSISAFYAKDHQTGYACIKNNIINNILKDNNKVIKTLENLSFYKNDYENDPDKLQIFYAINNKLSELAKSSIILSKELIEIWTYVFEQNRKALTAYQKYKHSQSDNPQIMITFTTCKRYDLFQETVNSILNHWTDVNKIDYWFCVDDNSNDNNRQQMREKYDWIDYYMKTSDKKGHRESMNIIWNKLHEIKPTYWIHIEDDFLFHQKMNYIENAIKGLSELQNQNVKQILFNRNYAETIANYNIQGHVQHSFDFVLHDHKIGKYPYSNNHYWPYYSFRPSFIDVTTILELGNYDSANQFFERDYADKWKEKGYKSAFFNTITNQHIGRLTSEIGNSSKQNAYVLNEQEQFTNKPDFPSYLINLDRRTDRLSYCKSKLTFNFERFSAIDGSQLNNYSDFDELYNTIEGQSIIPGEIGVKLSHYSLWNNIKEPTLILEDDIMVNNTTYDEIKKVFSELGHIQEPWDILFVGGQWTPNYGINSNCYMDVHKITDKEINTTFIPIHPHFYKRNYCYHNDVFNTPLFRTPAAYIISEQGAKKIINIINQNKAFFMKEPLDMWLLLLEKEKKITMVDYFNHPFYQGGFDLMKEDCLLKTDIHRDKKELFTKSNIKDEFVFIQGQDEIGNDIQRIDTTNITNALSNILRDPNCVAINTLGFTKNKVTQLKCSEYFKNNDGIYIKKEYYNTLFVKRPNVKRVKLLGNFWDTQQELVNEFNYMIPDKSYQYKDIEITCSDINIDYYIIINQPKTSESYYDPLKTLVFTLEPEALHNPYGTHTWGKWANPDPKEFLYVHTRDKLNAVQWRLNVPYEKLVNKQTKYINKVASIVSSKKYFEGHKKRIDFIKYIQDERILNVYGKENYHDFKNYKGALPDDEPYSILMPHKYYFMTENNQETNYATEKIWEPILCESLCFYWGCPNLTDYINPQAFVQLDLNDFEKSKQIIIQAIKEDWWSQRIDIIRKEKEKILNQLAFFPTIHNILSLPEKLTFLTFGGPSNYHKTVDRICDEATQFNLFTEIIGLKDDYLKNNTQFWDKHATFIDNNPVGYGYWLWKPYIVKKQLEKMKDNEILCYIDAGCVLNNSPTAINRFKQYINLVKNNEYGLLSFELPGKECEWTKMDTIHYLNANNIMNTNQLVGGIFIIRKTERNINMVNKWYETCCNYQLIDETPSTITNDSSFKEHRHDQSVWSIIRKQEGSSIIKDETFFKNPNDEIDYPILAKRKRII